jgi:hypothetical protein
MGNKESRPPSQSTSSAAAPQPASQPGNQASAPQQTAAPAQASPQPLKQVDVVITATPGDAALVSVLASKIEAEKLTVYSNTSTTDEAAKELGRLLVDAKLLIFVISEESVVHSKCADQVSLAYISNKPIIPIARNDKSVLTKNITFGLKLTLEQLSWLTCTSDQPDDDFVREFISQIHQALNPSAAVSLEQQPQEPAVANANTKRSRMNTKLRSQTTNELPQLEEIQDTFWDRNFGTADKVQWFRFQQSFITEYDTQLKNLFTDEHIPWLLEDVLHKDILGGAEEITRDHFMLIRGDSKEKHIFWKMVRQVSVEKFNMKEVFNMKSTVRLAAIENLGKFQNEAVIDALLLLLDDPDANVRAVAAISLGRTGVKEDYIIDRLIELLKDSDRIVRQSACLSLGALKAVKAIPGISDRWRNDFISVVRDAARTALEKMNVPEAEEVLKVTKVLESEIKHLEGKIVSV